MWMVLIVAEQDLASCDQLQCLLALRAGSVIVCTSCENSAAYHTHEGKEKRGRGGKSK